MNKLISLDRLSDFLTNLKGSFVTKTDAKSTYETKANAANIYETKEDAATHLTKAEASETYATKDELGRIDAATYLTKTDAESTYETKANAAAHLTKTDAANIYETKEDAATHLTKTEAANTYATKDELGRIDAATYLTKTDAESTYETKANAANIYETKKDAATHLTKTEASKTYITKANAADIYETKEDAATTYLTKTEASKTYESKTDAATHLTKTEASKTYITKADAADTYESKTDAATHLTKTEASKTYITKADAADTYVTKDELNGIIYGGKNYSIIIDFSLSDPASMITYTDDIDIDPMDTRWFDELGLKLCVLNDGVVQYYLDPNDVTKKLDGSAADITTLGNDVMLEIPRMGTNCSWLDSNRLKITITTTPNRTGYDYRAFSLHKYNLDCDKIYIGRYHAYVENNRMFSSSGKTPITEQTLATYRTCATNRGTGYTDIGICDDILLQCLYLLIVKNFNSQSAVGRGICDTRVRHNTGEANTFGWLNTGSPDKTNGNTAVCCLGIENFWGNVWVWEDGIIRNSDRKYFMAQYADQYNSDATGYEYIAQASDTKEGFQGRCAGIPKFIFMPDASTVAASGRGESTYMCDYQWIDESITAIAAFGGNWSNGSKDGAFARRLDFPVSHAYGTFSSRLCFKKIAKN